jgi:hypothetical protein
MCGFQIKDGALDACLLVADVVLMNESETMASVTTIILGAE